MSRGVQGVAILGVGLGVVAVALSGSPSGLIILLVAGLGLLKLFG